MSVRVILKRFLSSRLGLLSLGLIALVALSLLGGEEPRSRRFLVERVVDGDTIEVKGLRPSIRYLGIDCPEIPLPDSPGEPLGEEAREFNRSLVLGKAVRLEFDEERYDHYGRLLAYVFVGDVFINEELVREGLASALYIEPNFKYESRIIEAENLAKRERKGIWASLDELAPPASNSHFLLKPGEADGYVGRRAVVRGRITGHRSNRKVVALTMHDDFDVVIFTHDLGNFSFFGIDPVDYYEGKLVEVTGRVSAYGGRPQIVVAHPMALRVLN